MSAKRTATPNGTPSPCQSKRQKVDHSSPMPRRRRRRNKRVHLRFSVASVVSHLRRSQYLRVLRHLLSLGTAAQRAFDKVVAGSVRQQVRRYVKSRQSDAFHGSDSISDFCWTDHIASLNSHLPTFMSALAGAMPQALAKDRHQLV